MINVRMQPTENKRFSPRISVVAVGGAGGNAVDNMIDAGMAGVEFVVCNTDAQALNSSLSDQKIQLGASVTSGLGAGAKPDVGKMAAEETLDEVMSHIDGANMVFVTAGMGGGTGTGAAPVIAKACRERDILTVGVVTKPFHFEGSRRMSMAEQGISELQEYVDTLIVIPNQNLFRIANEKTTFSEAFKMADSVLQSGVRGVTDLIVNPGLINLDFADIRSIMLEMGKAVMGTGEATGEKRAVEAAEKAISNPLLDDMSMKGAKGVIINVTGGHDMTLFEADEACNRIREEVDPEANIIFGTSFDDTMEGTMRVSIVATGIDTETARKTGGVSPNLNLERAKPRTVASPSGSTAQQQFRNPVAAASRVTQNFVQPQTAPIGAQASVSEEPGDLFEQTSPTTEQAQQPTQTYAENRNVLTAEQKTVSETPAVLRGSTYGEAFIPPSPATAETYGSTAHMQMGGAGQQQQQVQQQSVGQAATAPSLKLNPPVPGAQKSRKSPSLFERITGGAWRQDETDEFSSDTSATDTSEGGQGTTGGATPTTPSQNKLNVEKPSKTSVEDELDIPAFLRRQAN